MHDPRVDHSIGSHQPAQPLRAHDLPCLVPRVLRGRACRNRCWRTWWWQMVKWLCSESLQREYSNLKGSETRPLKIARLEAASCHVMASRGFPRSQHSEQQRRLRLSSSTPSRSPDNLHPIRCVSIIHGKPGCLVRLRCEFRLFGKPGGCLYLVGGLTAASATDVPAQREAQQSRPAQTDPERLQRGVQHKSYQDRQKAGSY